MIAYKLTNQDQTTHEGCKWTVGEWKETNGDGALCGPGWLHAYTDPLLAVLLNPFHARLPNPRLWEAEVKGKCQEANDFKVGYTQMRLTRELEPHKFTVAQIVHCAILCAKLSRSTAKWKKWANQWLNGKDRSKHAADKAANEASGPAEYAATIAAKSAASLDKTEGILEESLLSTVMSETASRAEFRALRARITALVRRACKKEQ